MVGSLGLGFMRLGRAGGVEEIGGGDGGFGGIGSRPPLAAVKR